MFTNKCLEAFGRIKQPLILAPIIQPAAWLLPFELMCNASNFSVEAVLVQGRDKKSFMTYYASKTFDEAQINYLMMDKEMLAVVFIVEKCYQYLLGYKVAMFTNHSTLKNLMEKKNAKLRLICWVVFL